MGTIFDALRSADYNLNNSGATISKQLGRNQVHNVVVILDKGYDLYDDIDDLLDKFGTVEEVPEKGKP